MDLFTSHPEFLFLSPPTWHPQLPWATWASAPWQGRISAQYPTQPCLCQHETIPPCPVAPCPKSSTLGDPLGTGRGSEVSPSLLLSGWALQPPALPWWPGGAIAGSHLCTGSSAGNPASPAPIFHYYFPPWQFFSLTLSPNNTREEASCRWSIIACSQTWNEKCFS